MNMEKKRPNCYECKYRGTVPGDAHSCCKHPSIQTVKDDPMGELLATLAGVGRVAPINAKSKTLNIKGAPRGIQRGWFNWPWNFDPIWLENCDGFEKK